MKSIGFRLTLLYVCAVAGLVVVIFFLGEYLLSQQIRRSLDAMLAERFSELRDRLTADPVRSNLDLTVLLPGQPAATPFYVKVEDRWDDAKFRDARRNGEPVLPPPAERFFDTTWSNDESVRVIEGVSESLRLRIATPLAPVTKAIERYIRIGLTVTSAMFGLSLVAGALLSRAALRPVRLIQRTAARIRSDNLSERIPVGEAQDEISSLAQLLNQTFDRLEGSFEQIKRFSAEASHEMKTPLSLIRLNVERLLGEEQLSSSGTEALQDAIQEIHRLDKLIERLLFLSRAQAGEVVLDCQPQDPSEFIASFLHDGHALAEPVGVTCEVAVNERGRVSFDANRMRQVLFNLLANALDATPPGGRVVLHSVIRAGSWQVTMEDEGVGLPADKCEVIFERFVRIKQSTKGAGLGLAICRSIVGLHRGRIYAEPKRGERGLRLTLEMPIDSVAMPAR
jgi:two-component system heavy metal sensor histidine kinase CusS